VVEYTWDPDKEAENVRKHGVSFQEARTVLRGYLTVTWPDVLHSAQEPRFKSIGYSDLGRILVVVTSDNGIQPRIISAWRASKRERDAYQRRRQHRLRRHP
jgi:uncharacterized DUF497 family protein